MVVVVVVVGGGLEEGGGRYGWTAAGDLCPIKQRRTTGARTGHAGLYEATVPIGAVLARHAATDASARA